MKKIKVKDIKELIKNLSDDINFEIDISDGKIGKRSVSDDIRYMHQIETGKSDKSVWINIIN
jgi:hypothetical protein